MTEKSLIERMRALAVFHEQYEQGGGASMLLNEGADALEEAVSLIVALQAELAHQIGT